MNRSRENFGREKNSFGGQFTNKRLSERTAKTGLSKQKKLDLIHNQTYGTSSNAQNPFNVSNSVADSQKSSLAVTDLNKGSKKGSANPFTTAKFQQNLQFSQSPEIKKRYKEFEKRRGEKKGGVPGF